MFSYFQMYFLTGSNLKGNSDASRLAQIAPFDERFAPQTREAPPQPTHAAPPQRMSASQFNGGTQT